MADEMDSAPIARGPAPDREARRARMLRRMERLRNSDRWISVLELASWCANQTGHDTQQERRRLCLQASAGICRDILKGMFAIRTQRPYIVDIHGPRRFLPINARSIHSYLLGEGFVPGGYTSAVTQHLAGYPRSDAEVLEYLGIIWLPARPVREWLADHGALMPPRLLPKPLTPVQPPTQQQVEGGPLKTGAPGRPTSMHLVEAEYERRTAAGIAETALAVEARALAAWLVNEHPQAPALTEKTISNRLRERHRGARKPAPDIIDEP